MKKPSARERNAAVLAARVDKIMGDTRHPQLRTRPVRIALVVALACVLAVQPLVWQLAGILAGLATVLLAWALWAALRRSVRVISDLPDEYLDERQRGLRNAAYLESYRWLAGLVSAGALVVLVATVLVGQGADRLTLHVTFNAVMGIFWLVEGAALALPAMVVALRDRELPE